MSSKTAYVCTAHTLMPLIHSAMTREGEELISVNREGTVENTFTSWLKKSLNYSLDDSNRNTLKSNQRFCTKKTLQMWLLC